MAKVIWRDLVLLAAVLIFIWLVMRWGGAPVPIWGYVLVAMAWLTSSALRVGRSRRRDRKAKL